MQDPYLILGVQRTDRIEDVKKAYFKLAKKFHPDLNQTDSEEAA